MIFLPAWPWWLLHLCRSGDYQSAFRNRANLVCFILPQWSEPGVYCDALFHTLGLVWTERSLGPQASDSVSAWITGSLRLTAQCLQSVKQKKGRPARRKRKKKTEKEKNLQVELVANTSIFHNQMFSQKVSEASDLDSVSLQHLRGWLESLRCSWI